VNVTTERLMRILMIAPSAVAGGQEEVLFQLAVGAAAYGAAADVISLADGVLNARLIAEGVPVRLLPAGRLREPHRLALTTRLLSQALSGRRHDLVLSNMPKAHLYAALPARRHRVPALWCQAGFPEPASWMDRLASALPAAGVIAVSRDAAEAQRRVNARLPVHLMHPGIDLGAFAPGDDAELRRTNGIAQDAVLVSLVGRLQPWKGQREFLRAAARIAAGNARVRFAIVGGAILGWEGGYPAELRALAGSLGIADRVIFTGHTAEVHRWMAASDVVVNASEPEPFGLVVVEAMASGCAVVGVRRGGPRDIIEHDRSGLLCRSSAPEDLAAAVGRLVDDAGLRRELGSGAVVRARTFSREAMIARFGEIAHATCAAAGTTAGLAAVT
jgi:glycosyltransferase involved in cell wall biosynthesis